MKLFPWITCILTDLFVILPCISQNDTGLTFNHQPFGVRRNLFIIQDDYNEFCGTPGACTIALLRALQAECAPILVSSSLWTNMCIYLRLHGDEHFLKPKKKRWLVYKVTAAVYLAVPMSYQERLCQVMNNVKIENKIIDHYSRAVLAPDDIVLGCKCSRFVQLQEPFACTLPRLGLYSLNMLATLLKFKADINPEILRKTLITREDASQIPHYPGLEIFLLGHGRASRLLRNYIAGFSINEFRLFLATLKADFNVSLLMYQTCYGGGPHLVVPYVTHGQPDLYPFPIVTCCSGALPASVIYDPFSVHNLDFSKIFKDLSDSSTELDLADRLASFFPHRTDSLKKRVLHNIPQIRMSGSPEFVAVAGTIENPSIQIYKPPDGLDKQKVIIQDVPAFLFYGYGIIAPIEMKGTCASIIPMDPFAKTFFFNTIDAREHTFHDLVLYSFCPVSMVEVPESTFLIRQLFCKLNSSEDRWQVLHNVTIKCNRSNQLLQTAYEQELEDKYLRNYTVRKKATYSFGNSTYSFYVKPLHGPDFLGKTLYACTFTVNIITGGSFPYLHVPPIFRDPEPHRVWVFGKQHRLQKSQARIYERDFCNQFKTIVSDIASQKDVSA